MMRIILILLTTFSFTSFAMEPVKSIEQSGFKRVELGAGLIYGQWGAGTKVKYQLSDYLVGLEINSIELSDSHFLGPHTRDINNESGDYWVLTASIGKDWSYGWLNAALDFGVGYGVSGDHKNCTNEYDDGYRYELCDYEIERAITFPLSATFVIGKGVGIGLSLTHSISTLEYNTGLKIVIPFGSFD